MIKIISFRSSCNGVLPVWPATMPEREKRLRWKLKLKQPGKPQI